VTSNQARTLSGHGYSRVWARKVGRDVESVSFAASFRLNSRTDLREFAESLPEGVVLCDPSIIAGVEHLEAILLQTREYWDRGERLVRNGSIEILMRLASKSQILEAVESSGIENTSCVTILGLVSSEVEVEHTIKRFLSTFGWPVEDAGLIDLDKEKASKLKKSHGLRPSLSNRELQTALCEGSVLLMFSK
jgi:tRNA threonylcarbamoyladenosine modification (KEOPS) complex Cgi121 subunit